MKTNKFNCDDKVVCVTDEYTHIKAGQEVTVDKYIVDGYFYIHEDVGSFDERYFKLVENESIYEIKEVVCDCGIFENGKLVLILNDYMNAKYILDILRHDEQKKRYSNMITLR